MRRSRAGPARRRRAPRASPDRSGSEIGGVRACELGVGGDVVDTRHEISDIERANGGAALTERLALGRSAAGEGLREPGQDHPASAVVGEAMHSAVGAGERERGAGSPTARESAPAAVAPAQAKRARVVQHRADDVHGRSPSCRSRVYAGRDRALKAPRVRAWSPIPRPRSDGCRWCGRRPLWSHRP